MIRWLTAAASPAGERAKLAAFLFHRVPAHTDPMFPGEPDARRFDAIVQWIASQFRVLDPVDACERLAAGTLPSRAAIVTFDDGYRDNVEVALPILERHGVRAAFFIATAYLNGGAMFNDRIFEAVRRTERTALDPRALFDGASHAPAGAEALPDSLHLGDTASRRATAERIITRVKHLPPAERRQAVDRLEAHCGVHGGYEPMMRPEQVRELRARGMCVGGHTRTHPILASLDPDAAWEEIRGGRDDLCALLGSDVDLFAYPNGRLGRDFQPPHAAMARRAGYRFAFTTEPGAAQRDTDAWMLPRFTPWDRTRVRFGLRALRNLGSKRPAST